VKDRAQKRWNALVAGKLTTAYQFNTAAFRAVVSPEKYPDKFGNGGFWIGAEVVDVTCPVPERCTARVRVDFKPMLLAARTDKITTHKDETWLLENGQWWFYQAL